LIDPSKIQWLSISPQHAIEQYDKFTGGRRPRELKNGRRPMQEEAGVDYE
jgi:hypothetical protein